MIFLESWPDLISPLKQAMSKQDLLGIERAAHAIKGSVSNFGADRAKEKALILETQARNGQKEGLEATFQELKDEVEAFKTQLEGLV